jgi:hypothetical protein
MEEGFFAALGMTELLKEAMPPPFVPQGAEKVAATKASQAEACATGN